MKRTKKVRGISLIVLVITIIVMLILASVIILAVTNTGVFSMASEASMKTIVTNMNASLDVYVVNKMAQTDGQYNRSLLYADSEGVKYNGVIVAGETLEGILGSNEQPITIVAGELVYNGESLKEQKWFTNTLKGTNYTEVDMAEGEDNVLIEDATAGEIINLRIYGDSEQEGTPTPTPTNPIHVFSLGERTRNLFDITKAENGTIVTTSGVNYDIVNRCRTTYIYLNAGTYKLSTLDGVAFGGYTHMYSTPNQRAWLGTAENLETTLLNGRIIKTVIIPQDCYIREVLLPSTGSAVDDLSITNLSNYKPIIEQSTTTATEYIPYNAIEVVSRGKNLWDFKNTFLKDTMIYRGITYTKSQDGIMCNGIATAQSYTTPYEMVDKLVNGNTYRISTSYVDAIPVIEYIKNEVKYYGRSINMNENVTSVKVYFYFYTNVSVNNVLVKMQLEEGTTPTDYEPYQETVIIDLTEYEPLRKIGDVSDYIDYANSRIVRNIGKYEITGEERFWIGSTTQTNIKRKYIQIPTANTKIVLPTVLPNLLCTNYEPVTNNQNYRCIQGISIDSVTSTYTQFGIFDERYTDNSIDGFRTWITQQHDAGTPVTVYYQLAEPKYEHITLPKIVLREGINNITVNGASKIEAIYGK